MCSGVTSPSLPLYRPVALSLVGRTSIFKSSRTVPLLPSHRPMQGIWLCLNQRAEQCNLQGQGPTLKPGSSLVRIQTLSTSRCTHCPLQNCPQPQESSSWGVLPLCRLCRSLQTTGATEDYPIASRTPLCVLPGRQAEHSLPSPASLHPLLRAPVNLLHLGPVSRIEPELGILF